MYNKYLSHTSLVKTLNLQLAFPQLSDMLPIVLEPRIKISINKYSIDNIIKDTYQLSLKKVLRISSMQEDKELRRDQILARDKLRLL